MAGWVLVGAMALMPNLADLPRAPWIGIGDAQSQPVPVSRPSPCRSMFLPMAYRSSAAPAFRAAPVGGVLLAQAAPAEPPPCRRPSHG